MRYLGSKTLMANQIYGVINDIIPDGSFCDPFGGIGVVGSHFKSRGYEVHIGDILRFPHYFQISKIQLNKYPSFSFIQNINLGKKEEIIAKVMNNIKPINGWLVEEYARKRNFFTIQNAKKIQGCLNQIKTWQESNLLTLDEFSILISSLIESMDRVANTAGTYYAYLKKMSEKALRQFDFRFITPIVGTCNCKAYFIDAIEMMKQKSYDIIYLDPPYNERSYAHYYHLPETIANLNTPIPLGKSGIPIGEKVRSDFNHRQKAIEALSRIMQNAKFKLLVFHYAENGLLQNNTIDRILNRYGRVKYIELLSRKYSATQAHTLIKNSLYLVHND
jgi:adenine-specific DNA-methyltransferase